MPILFGAAGATAIFGVGVYLFDWFTDDLTETTGALTLDASQAALIGLIGVGAYVALKGD